MIAIGIILIIFVFFLLCGLASIKGILEVMIKYQNELIKVLKNADK